MTFWWLPWNDFSVTWRTRGFGTRYSKVRWTLVKLNNQFDQHSTLTSSLIKSWFWDPVLESQMYTRQVKWSIRSTLVELTQQLGHRSSSHLNKLEEQWLRHWRESRGGLVVLGPSTQRSNDHSFSQLKPERNAHEATWTIRWAMMRSLQQCYRLNHCIESTMIQWFTSTINHCRFNNDSMIHFNNESLSLQQWFTLIHLNRYFAVVHVQQRNSVVNLRVQ